MVTSGHNKPSPTSPRLEEGSVMKVDTWASATVGVVFAVVSLTVTWASRSDALESELVRCVDVTQPAALANCGADPLTGGGTAEISKEGEVEISIAGAEPNVIYRVVYHSLDGAAEGFIGELRTDATGNGHLDVEGVFATNQVAAGYVVLARGGTRQFVTGSRIGK
jgi:hypothetical protein